MYSDHDYQPDSDDLKDYSAHLQETNPMSTRRRHTRNITCTIKDGRSGADTNRAFIAHYVIDIKEYQNLSKDR